MRHNKNVTIKQLAPLRPRRVPESWARGHKNQLNQTSTGSAGSQGRQEYQIAEWPEVTLGLQCQCQCPPDQSCRPGPASQNKMLGRAGHSTAFSRHGLSAL